MKIRANFAKTLAYGVYRFFIGDPVPEWKPDPKMVAEEEAKRAADPEAYDRETIGMMPRIPHD